MGLALSKAAAVAALALGCMLHATASAQRPMPCAYDDKACASAEVLKHPAFTMRFWQPNLRRPLEERIGAPPPELVEFLHLAMILQGLDYRPRAGSTDPAFAQDVRQAVAELPDEIKAPLARKLAGIFLVEDFWCCAWADRLFDDKRRAVGGMVALNQSILRGHTANSWATWKENTPFSPHPAFRLVMEIAPPGEDNRKNLIQYLLLHELGHVYSIGNAIHPSWNIDPKNVRSTAPFRYFRLTWSIAKEENRYVTVFDDNVFADRKDLVYFRKPRLPAERMIPVYESLEKTNFPTLYSAVIPAEDFAEAFATYVHTVLMKKPFSVRIYKDGALAKTYNACWEEARCAEKRKILERVIRRENERVASQE